MSQYTNRLVPSQLKVSVNFYGQVLAEQYSDLLCACRCLFSPSDMQAAAMAFPLVCGAR